MTFKSGPDHIFYGKHFTPEHKDKIRIKLKGSNNGMWKGNSVGNYALHLWLRTNFQKPELCQICNADSPYDLANITGIYNRDFNNWKYLCRRCHMLSDGRMKNLRSGMGWPKGKPRSDETKYKLRIANLGKRASEETKQKMRKAHRRYSR